MAKGDTKDPCPQVDGVKLVGAEATILTPGVGAFPDLEVLQENTEGPLAGIFMTPLNLFPDLCMCLCRCEFRSRTYVAVGLINSGVRVRQEDDGMDAADLDRTQDHDPGPDQNHLFATGGGNQKGHIAMQEDLSVHRGGHPFALSAQVVAGSGQLVALNDHPVDKRDSLPKVILPHTLGFIARTR